MARTIAEINQEIIQKVEQDETLSVELTSTSKVAIWRLWAYIVAASIWTLEKLFDLHKKEVTDYIANSKPHSLRWYVSMAKAFQYGRNLMDDEAYYDNSGLTDEVVESERIVAYAAVVEQDRYLRVKVAKDNGGDLEPLSASNPDELGPFVEYMNRIKDAGVRLVCESKEADALRLKLTVYYNPLVLSGDGSRLDGASNNPILEAVRNYLKNLPFNGNLVKEYLRDALQQVDGVVVPVIDEIFTKYGTNDFADMGEIYNPDAGYIRIADEDFITPTFIPQTPL